MNILIVAHNFPPRHHAGAEVYSAHLAKALVEKGHEVSVYSTDQTVFRRNYSRRRYRWEGIPVYEVTNQRRYPTFEHSYADPRMVEHFMHVLRRTQPDIVHFQHLLHHSVLYPSILRQLGIPSVLTLHEYWFMCGRNGQLIQQDETRCLLPQMDTCASCLSRFMWGRKAFDVWGLRSVQLLKAVTGMDVRARVRSVRIAGVAAEPSSRQLTDMKREVLVREARMRDMFDSIDCFVAPSPFLKDRFVEWGLDEERLILSDYGTDVRGFGSHETPPSDRLRIGFLGSVQSVKGVHVLLRAVDGIDPERYELRIWGDLTSKPEYVKRLRSDTRGSVRLQGRIDRDQIPGVLRELDVLVVPSIWWENSPLVIHEAFAAGVPVLCSGIGGMADLVADDVSGWHFPPGDHRALRVLLARLIDDPQQLERLKQGIPRVKTMVQDAEFHEELFERVVSSHEEWSAMEEESLLADELFDVDWPED